MSLLKDLALKIMGNHVVKKYSEPIMTHQQAREIGRQLRDLNKYGVRLALGNSLQLQNLILPPALQKYNKNNTFEIALRI